MEIHIHAPRAVCESRDPKGLYQRARQGRIAHFTGIAAAYEAPEQPDLLINTSTAPAAASAARIVDFLLATGRIAGSRFAIA